MTASLRRPAARQLAALLLPAVPVLLVGCAPDGDDIDAIPMSEDQVHRVLSEYLYAVDGYEPLTPYDTPTFSEYGCIPSFPSALPSGPPWRHEAQRRHGDPTDAQIDAWRAAARRLTDRGFVEVTPARPHPDDDPRDIVMRNGRDFGVSITIEGHADRPGVEVTVTASSPCVRSVDEPPARTTLETTR